MNLTLIKKLYGEQAYIKALRLNGYNKEQHNKKLHRLVIYTQIVAERNNTK